MKDLRCKGSLAEGEAHYSTGLMYQSSDLVVNGNLREKDRTIGKPVLYVQLNGIFNVVHGFLVRFALTVATMESGTGNEKTMGVCFDDDPKSDVSHRLGHYRSVLES